MATELRYPKGYVFFDNNGDPLASGTVEYFEAGTTTNEPIYSDAAGAVALPNPITLNSAGRAVDGSSNLVAIYLSDAGATDYKEVVKDSGGTTIWTDDDIPQPVDPTAGLSDFAKPVTEYATDTASTKTVTAGMLGGRRLADTASNNITYSLLSASTAGNGKSIFIKKVSASNSVIVDADGSETIDGAADFVWTQDDQEFEFVSDGANWRIGASHSTPPIRPQGYLTLTSGTPVIASDASAQTSVYYTPDQGNLVPIYTGAGFVSVAFSELTLTLNSNHAASTIYDIFAWLESGVLTIGTGPAWSTSTAGSGARGTGAGTTQLTRTKGLYLNTVSMTTRNGATTYTVAASRATYLGSIFIDSTQGQATCHRSFGQSRKWALWNAHNRRPIILKAGDTTATWTYTSTSLRASNNAAANSLTIFAGLAEELFTCEFAQNLTQAGDAGSTMQIGIGHDSTSSASGKTGRGSIDPNGVDSANFSLQAKYIASPQIGISVITALEAGSASSSTFNGGNDDMLLTAQWMG